MHRDWRASAKPFDHANLAHGSWDNTHAASSEKPICIGKDICDVGPNEYDPWA